MAKSKAYKLPEEKPKTVSEPVATAIRGSRGIMFLGALEKPEYNMTALEKMEKLRLGLSKHDLEKLKSRTELDYDKLSNALSVTRATLINKKGTEKFSATISERMIGLADIYSYGYEVFEDEAKFNDWMFRPNRALGGKLPYDVIDNQFGREEVKNIIGRIDYGVYS
ncbi:antitoxin Xre/MbcA/ParS toxin-binding domain-containing protein [Flavobacterium sp. DGU11]|uniref:Antitoxin Xre/MbcA/ParS toxin-binding domain-containing protein n=1 Tax=Flavobacterium arundinis TaxID=3139143 RepID=A0ABU9HS33_9FLAO